MNNSRSLAILGVALITIVSAALCGCTGQTTDDTGTHASPTTTTASPTATAGTDDDNSNVPSGVSTKDGVTTMSGSTDASFPFHSEEGGYKLVFQSKGNALTGVQPIGSSGIGVPMFASAGMSEGVNGGYEMSRIEHWYAADDENWKITATGPYVVKIIRLPESVTPDSVPVSYSGKGWQVVGPFKLNAGTTTFTFDFSSTACAVDLVDGVTGSLVMTSDYKAATLFTNAGGETQFDVPAEGVYYVQVNTNAANAWKITIKQ